MLANLAIQLVLVALIQHTTCIFDAQKVHLKIAVILDSHPQILCFLNI